MIGHFQLIFFPISATQEEDLFKNSKKSFNQAENFPELALNSEQFSHYELTVKLDEINLGKIKSC